MDLKETEGEGLEQIRQNFDFQYPHKNLQGLYVKTSVSELKMKAMEEKDVTAYELFEEKEFVPYVPDFIEKKEKVSGAARGDAYHRVMELIDLEEKDVKGAIENFVRKGFLSIEQAECIECEKIERFLASPVAEKMRNAKRIRREESFTIMIDAKDVFENGESETLKNFADILEKYI